MKLYWCERTRAVRAAWMLEELGVPYELVRIDIRDEQSRADPAFRAASPMGKVPALEDGAVRIWDSGAICAYLADQYPAAKLAPPIGSPDRGTYLMWLMYTNAVIEPAMGEKFGGLKSNPVSYGWGSWEQMLERPAHGAEPWAVDSWRALLRCGRAARNELRLLASVQDARGRAGAVRVRGPLCRAACVPARVRAGAAGLICRSGFSPTDSESG